MKKIMLALIALLLLPGPAAEQASVAFAQQGNNSNQAELNELLLPYRNARSITDYSQRELAEWIPELRNLEFARTQDDLPSLLDRVGERVEEFYQNLPSTYSIENIYQEREGPGGRWEEYLRLRYHYVITASSKHDELSLDEYRVDLKDERLTYDSLKGAFMLTSGFASHPLYFHPSARAACSFRLIGKERSGRKATIIAFAQIPGKTRMPGSIALSGGRRIAILLQGVIWVAPDNCQILRMQTDLLVRRSDVGLKQFTARVDFDGVAFAGLSQKLWLPREVLVTVQCEGKTFRNSHRYTQYKLFSVESQEGPHKPARP
jgi:hypothetical protein